MPRETEVDVDHSYDPDWRRVRGISPCPMLIANRGCDGGECICRHADYSSILQHGTFWVDGDGDPVITYEPCQWEGVFLAAFILHCEGLGLSVNGTGKSPHNLGETMQLIVRPASPGLPF